MTSLILIIAACGTSEVTAGPEDAEVSESGLDITDILDPDDDEDTTETEPSPSGVDASPGVDGNLLIRIEMGRSEQSIAFWYGYCADRTAADCPEWALMGTVANQEIYEFRTVETVGSLRFDGYIDTDGDGEIDKEVVDEDDEGECYRTGGWTVELDGWNVSGAVEPVDSDDQGCILGLSLDDAWGYVPNP